jgi:hypothetical protein
VGIETGGTVTMDINRLADYKLFLKYALKIKIVDFIPFITEFNIS